jgi:hypothetical protein
MMILLKFDKSETVATGHFLLLAFIPLVNIMFPKKDGGISVVAKKRPAIGTFF